MSDQTHTSVPCSFSHNLKSLCWKMRAQLLCCQLREQLTAPLRLCQSLQERAVPWYAATSVLG